MNDRRKMNEQKKWQRGKKDRSKQNGIVKKEKKVETDTRIRDLKRGKERLKQ